MKRNGFTLLEILLVLSIIGVLTAFGLTLAASVKGMTKLSDTRNRLRTVQANVVDYYNGHGRLPVAAAGNQVPNDAGLDLEQKFRLDGWGQYIFYSIGNESRIDDLVVNGKKAAGVIISGGPDQVLAAANTDGDGTFFDVEDDVLMTINVFQHAKNHTLEELQVLQDKVRAFDRLFEGVDNDHDGVIDEDGCVADDLSGGGCPPTGRVDTNCGRRTLDGMIGKSLRCAWPTATPVAFLSGLYGLPDLYLTDAWGRDYQWDPEKHKFYSMGPDGATSAGDDIFP